MTKIATVLCALLGWGFGEAMGPRLYPEHPQAWFFVKALAAACLAWVMATLGGSPDDGAA